jgi:hypothetical protein
VQTGGRRVARREMTQPPPNATPSKSREPHSYHRFEASGVSSRLWVTRLAFGGAQSASKLTSESVSKTGKVSSREISGSRVAREKSSGGNDKTKRRLTNHQRESVVESQTVVVPRRRRETLFFFFLSFLRKTVVIRARARV